MKRKVVILDWYDKQEIPREALENIDAEFVFSPARTGIEAAREFPDTDILVIDSAPITAEAMDRFEKLKLIAVGAAGYNSVDIEAATERGILVTNVPSPFFCADEVSDHTVALALALIRKLIKTDSHTRKGLVKFSFPVDPEVPRLKGSVAGIIGLGAIGRRTVNRLKALGMKIIAYDPFITPGEAAKTGVNMVPLDTLLKEADLICLHAPLTKDTEHLIGEEQLRSMKKTAYIVNTSRGALIDQKALIKALSEGWIAGAGLDVLEDEPPPGQPADPENPLFKLENILVTPHIAYYSKETNPSLWRMVAKEIDRAVKGEEPINPINPSVIQRHG